MAWLFRHQFKLTIVRSISVIIMRFSFEAHQDSKFDKFYVALGTPSSGKI